MVREKTHAGLRSHIIACAANELNYFEGTSTVTTVFMERRPGSVAVGTSV